MPNTPRTTRRASNSHRDVPVKSPAAKTRPQSSFEPSSIQDRIRQWQAQGAANAPAPDAVSVRSIPLSDNSYDEPPRPLSPQKKTPNSEPSWRQRFLEKERELRAEEKATREATAPKKRVISDEHWKAKKNEGKEDPLQAATRSHMRTPHHDLSYTSNQRGADIGGKEDQRRRLGRSREQHRPESAAVHDLNSYIDSELARHLGGSDVADDNSDRISEPFSFYAQDHEPPTSRSKYAESLGHQNSKPNSKSKPQNGRLLDKTKEIFSKNDDPPPPPNRVPSIEAWLDEQPDPFIDAEHEEQVPGVEVPEPLRRRSRRPRRGTSRRSTTDPNQIWESVTTLDEIPASRDRAPKSPLNLDQDESGTAERKKHGLKDASPESSPTNLRRRGARTQRKPQVPEHRSPSSRESPSAPSPLQPGIPNANKAQRACPRTGHHRLETIASVETFKENYEPPPYEDRVSNEPCELKRTLTTHEDLMSVLSFPMHRKSTRSRRRAQVSSSQSASEVLHALVIEEEKYSRELRTLVDGVIPVLLQCVLSKSGSAATAGLFTTSAGAGDELAVTTPIIDMGIALERLKSLHGRIPLQNVDALLGWAQNTQKAYNDYLKAWRLGFHDVVVNLAPLNGAEGNIDSGMSRDADGDVVNAEGKKVDVAYLLKRPLVRVKNLSKTFVSIQEKTQKPLAQDVARIYDDLTATARRRHQEEQARLEDEAAASIDPTRARNIRTLGPNPNAELDRHKKVRARDCFNLTIFHSTGQRLDCRIEMIFRDNPTFQSPGGDVLICEVDETGKWLLFDPVNLSSISARRGEDGFDLVIMIRGPSGIGQEWHELLAVTSEESAATTEWLSMLGSHPLPPKLNRTRSFMDAQRELQKLHGAEAKGLPKDPVATEVDIPIGEPSVVGRSEKSSAKAKSEKPLFERFIPRLNLGGGLQSRSPRSRHPNEMPSPKASAATILSDRSTISDLSFKELPKLPKASSAPSTPAKVSVQPALLDKSSTTSSTSFMMSGGLSPVDSPTIAIPVSHPSETKAVASNSSSQLSTPKQSGNNRENSAALAPAVQESDTAGRPKYSRAISSTPSQDLPTIAKLRPDHSEESNPKSTPLNESMRDQWHALSGDRSPQTRRRRRTRAPKSQIFTEDIPSPPAHGLNRQTPPSSALLMPQHPRQESAPVGPPAPPPHRDLSSMSRHSSSPATSGPELRQSPQPEGAKKRRSSSPLKREYAPSTASEPSSDSGSEDLSDSSSETSQDFMSEVQDMHTPLVAVTAGNRRLSKQARPQSAPASAPTAVPTSGTRTLAPSDSASQGPYRRVPSSSAVPKNKQTRTIALVCAWSDRGSWDQIYPDECSIVISPGLIEAFEMSAAHSGAQAVPQDEGSEGESRTSSLTSQPLVAFELTPIVPLRRGTALDINIRSPPAPSSKLKTTSNIMFRSRNADECDALYGMMNWARCNNPTYIQLQNARPNPASVTFNTGQPELSRPRSGSWFGLGGSQKASSYRASSAPGAMSVGGDSDASVGTMSTAISALKRLGVSSAFNLNRSSVIKKSGLSRTSGSLYSSSSGTRAGSGSSTPKASQLGFVPGKDGPNAPATSADAVGGAGMVNNMKIRLYMRKGQHWENVGAGRLSILPAPGVAPEASEGNAGDSGPGTGQSTPTRQPSTGVVGKPGSRGPRISSATYTPHRIHGNGREKRILIRKNKDNSIVLLDAVLGESCFERVMQTGIAVKTWQEEDEIGDTGGVVLGREQIYMMQFPGTREAGWVFGLCGSYRYGME